MQRIYFVTTRRPYSGHTSECGPYTLAEALERFRRVDGVEDADGRITAIIHMGDVRQGWRPRPSRTSDGAGY